MKDISEGESKDLMDLKILLVNECTKVNHMIYKREDMLSEDVKKLKYLHKSINNLIDDINKVLYR